MAERILMDYHMHSDISADSEATMKEMAAAALNKGLSKICFTEHLDIAFPGIDFSIDFERYGKVIDETREAFPELEIRQGIEAGLGINIKEETASAIEELSVDYVIGSVHTVHGMDPFSEEFWARYSKDEAFTEYLKACLECAGTCDYFDVFGHLGYITKGCPHSDKAMRYVEYSEIIDEIFKTLAKKGKGIEVNTSGLVMSPFTLPERAAVARFFELGGEIITIGSDAHRPDAVGRFIPETMDMIKEIGFKYVCAFEARQPVFIKL